MQLDRGEHEAALELQRAMSACEIPVAAWLPARPAARIEPVEALRSQ